MLPLLALLLTPAADEQAACRLGAGWGVAPSSAKIRNILSWADGRLTWNNVLISDPVLRQYLGRAARISPRPELVIDTTAMPCVEQMRLAAEVEAAGGCSPEICRAYAVVRTPPPPAPGPGMRDG